MSVTNLSAQVGPYTIASLPATLAVTFPFQAQTDFVVNNLGPASTPFDPATILTLNSDYTVTGGGYDTQNNMLTGSISVVGTGTHGVAVNDRIVITLAMPETQGTSFQSTGVLTVPMIERSLDKLTNVTKQISEGLKRTFKVPTASTALNELPTDSDRAGKMVGFDPLGNTQLYAPLNGTAVPVATSSALGAVKPDNTTISISVDGTISANKSTSSTLGIVKPDNSTTLVSAAGVLLAPSGTIIQSVAALRLVDWTPFSDKTPITLSGYYASGDGGGGQFYVDKADTTTADNGGTVIVASDGTRLKRIDKAILNPKWFGATGNGVTNDTASINAFLSQMNGLNAGAFIPFGVYLCDTFSIGGFGIKVSGQNRGASGNNTGSIIRCRTACTDFFSIAGIHTSLSDLSIDGAGLATNTVKFNDRASQWNLTRVEMSGCATNGVNCNLQPETLNMTLDEANFFQCNFNGSSGKHGVTNLRISSNNSVKITGYSCVFANSTNILDTDEVKNNINIDSGGLVLFDPEFQYGSTLSTDYDILFNKGSLGIYSARSENQGGFIHQVLDGRLTLVDCVHSAPNTVYTLVRDSGATIQPCLIEGGFFSNVLDNGSAGNVMVGVPIISGASLSGSNAAKVTIISKNTINTGTITANLRSYVIGPIADSKGLLKLQATNADYGSGLALFYSTTTPDTAARAWLVAPNFTENGVLEFLVSASNSTDPSVSVLKLSSIGAKLIGRTVTQLGSAATAGDGTIAYATDLTSTTSGATATGSGALKHLVVSNGTNWIVQ